jgi:hypothetical protein
MILVPPLVPAWGALVASLTGLVTLTSTHVYDLHYSTYTCVLTLVVKEPLTKVY